MRPIGSHLENGLHLLHLRRGGPQGSPAGYQQVSGALAGDAGAQRALQGMRDGGRLTAPLLGQLGRLARPGGDPAFLGQVVRDVADPGSIRQGRDNEFCAATTSLAGVAADHPAEYARIAADLKLTGRSRMMDGTTIQAQGSGAPGMSATQRLMAPALTEQANGPRYHVDDFGVSHATTRRAPRDTPRLDGTWAIGMERMQEMLEGGRYRSIYLPGDGAPRRAVRQAEHAISRSMARGQQPTLSADGHWYRVTGLSRGQLALKDQQSGQVRTENADQFLDSAVAVTFPARACRLDGRFSHTSKRETPGANGNGVRTSNPVDD